MASVTYGDKLYGLRDLKVRSIGASPTTEDLDAAQELTMTEEKQGDKLQGDDAVKAVISFTIGGMFKISAGAVSSAAMAIMSGRTLTTTGSTPNEKTVMTFSGGDRMPYFEIGGKSLDDEDGDAHIYLKKAKLTGNVEFKFSNGSWYTSGLEGYAVPDSSGVIATFEQNETAAALSWS